MHTLNGLHIIAAGLAGAAVALTGFAWQTVRLVWITRTRSRARIEPTEFETSRYNHD